MYVCVCVCMCVCVCLYVCVCVYVCLCVDLGATWRERERETVRADDARVDQRNSDRRRATDLGLDPQLGRRVELALDVLHRAAAALGPQQQTTSRQALAAAPGDATGSEQARALLGPAKAARW